MNYGKDEIILITRADDMGYTHTGNLGIMDSMRFGIIRSAAILAVAPWFEEAAQMARDNPDLCFGVHMAALFRHPQSRRRGRFSLALSAGILGPQAGYG
jgi:predicted glycoside hydrolase/deacetylase ChbG (UPF0249 family)